MPLFAPRPRVIVLLFTRTRSSPPLAKHLFQHYYYPSISFSSLNSKFKFFFCTSTSTSTSDPQSFTVSYLINNCGFSPETALKASRNLRLHNSQKPDSVLAFFTTHGFSNPQIRDIVIRDPWLLSCDPHKVILPKFEFFLSKGASPSDVVCMVSASPRILRRSLKNHIIPAYEFLKGFLQSDKQIITCMNRTFCFLSDRRVAPNVKLLLDEGMTHSNIVTLFRLYPGILCSSDLLNTVEELKQLGFDSSTSYFGTALRAKITVNKTKWAEKIETFKRWGWSQEQVLHAFKKQPYCMLSSTHKINAVMSFWVQHLGWNSLDLVRAPGILLLSLEKRIIPRASVLQFLISKGLRGKDAGISTPFVMSDKLFLQKFVNCFKEDSSHLLKLYEGKMCLANSSEKPPSSNGLFRIKVFDETVEPTSFPRFHSLCARNQPLTFEVTLSNYSSTGSHLDLPQHFAAFLSSTEYTSLRLYGEGVGRVKCSLLYGKPTTKSVKIGKGWKEFCKNNQFKAGKKLIFKFCFPTENNIVDVKVVDN